MVFPERTGLIIWLNHLKGIRALEKYGTLHYVSRRMKYAVLYVNQEKVEQTLGNLKKLNFVKKVDFSRRNEIKTEYDSKIPDKTRFYSI